MLHVMGCNLQSKMNVVYSCGVCNNMKINWCIVSLVYVYWWVVCDKLIQLASCCVNDSINDQQMAAVASRYKS